MRPQAGGGGWDEERQVDERYFLQECCNYIPRADFQGWGSILAWIVILSVYVADTIAEV
jgi:hypothetical protein